MCRLKTKPASPEALQSRYGSAVPGPALQALQRDGLIAGSEPHNHHVYQKPMAEVSSSNDSIQSISHCLKCFVHLCGFDRLSLMRQSWSVCRRSTGKHTGGCWVSCCSPRSAIVIPSRSWTQRNANMQTT